MTGSWAARQAYVILRDEHNNLVRVPTHTHPTLEYQMHRGHSITRILVQCEGVVLVEEDGTEQKFNGPMEAWLATCDQAEAEQRIDYDETTRRHRLPW